MENMEKLSSTLKHLLNEANISEAELARRTGIAQPMVNRLATGKNKNPKLETLQPIAKYFSVTFSQLLGEVSLPSGMETTDKYTNTGVQGLELPVLNWSTLEQSDTLASEHKMITTEKVSNDAFCCRIKQQYLRTTFPKQH